MADTYAILDAINDRVSSLGLFDAVLDHEPKSAPNTEGHLWAAWVLSWKPVASKSGLADTAMQLMVQGRIYRSFLHEPQDQIDRDLVGCVDAVIRECNSNISFGLQNEGVWTDLLGDNSEGVTASLGYVRMDQNKIYRICDLWIPVILTSYYTQEV